MSPGSSSSSLPLGFGQTSKLQRSSQLVAFLALTIQRLHMHLLFRLSIQGPPAARTCPHHHGNCAVISFSFFLLCACCPMARSTGSTLHTSLVGHSSSNPAFPIHASPGLLHSSSTLGMELPPRHRDWLALMFKFLTLAKWPLDYHNEVPASKGFYLKQLG